MAVLHGVSDYQAIIAGELPGLRAPSVPHDISSLRYHEAQLDARVNWLDRLAQLERSAYIRRLINEALTQG